MYCVYALIALICFVVSRNCEKCPYGPIAWVDIKDAVYTAQSTYRSHDVGGKIAGNGFEVTATLKRLYKGKTLRVLVVDKNSTRMISFAVEMAPRHLSKTIRQTMFKGKALVQFGGKNATVSPFLWGALNSLIPEIEPLIAQECKKYIITGHSLGGAIATLFAISMTGERNKIWQHKDSRLITFGEPRVGTKSFATLHDQLIHPRRKMRVTNGQDIIPHVPACLYGWRHASRELWMKNSYEWIIGGKKESLLRCVNTKYLSKRVTHHFVHRYVEKVRLYARIFKRIQRQSFRYRYYGFKVMRIKLHPYNSLREALNSVCTA